MMHVIADGYHDTGSFMAGNALGGGLHGDAEGGPFIVDEGFVRGTEAGPEKMLSGRGRKRGGLGGRQV
jgi:hypothetical protein